MNGTSTQTVFVVDPDPKLRAAVDDAAHGLAISCSYFDTAEEFLAVHTPGDRGCIVSELRLGGMGGLELQDRLKRVGRWPIVFVTAHAEVAIAVQAMRNGALTVLEKPFRQQEVWDAIREGLAQERKRWRIDARRKDAKRRLGELTDKERVVLDAIIQGKPNKLIARDLDISVRTVEARRHRVFKKTQTESVAALVRMIVQLREGNCESP